MALQYENCTINLWALFFVLDLNLKCFIYNITLSTLTQCSIGWVNDWKNWKPETQDRDFSYWIQTMSFQFFAQIFFRVNTSFLCWFLINSVHILNIRRKNFKIIYGCNKYIVHRDKRKKSQTQMPSANDRYTFWW